VPAVTRLWADTRHHGTEGARDREETMTMKERRVRCKGCGERFTVVRFERERPSAYCELCRAERKREQTQGRMQTLRARRRNEV
jgi:hypothetical protein